LHRNINGPIGIPNTKRPWNRLRTLYVIVRPDRTIQYAAASRFQYGVSGMLDRPLEPVIGRREAPTRWRAMAFLP